MTKASTFSNIIGKREVYGSGIFCRQIFKHSNYIYCGLCLDYYLAVLGWHSALGPTKSLTNVAQNLAQLIVNSIYAGTYAA